MAEGQEKNFNVSWDQLHRDTKALSWRLAEKGPWQRVVAIARGGLVPAAIVARERGSPCVVGTGATTKDLVDGEIVELRAAGEIVRIDP